MSEGPKKISLQEAVQQRLAEKKAAQNSKANLKGSTATKKLSSQQTKKASNTRRKMGT
ncbi:hypothetical protein [Lederbergia citrea]|uniref:Uncharacterized protein n=1 Tax=Lederbergia citrea TaxID=2833581 RepID=A0A942UIB3_9BACI|nr:hypothetical protein [Lederbergia citrea]MBS4176772.1 hypothetical protein [Lederbergia citrea]MBS4203333.1 hypothetical protein [Lederbergia citrea]MBS4221995.1 hypothetical protein [Lederbergia citrea]